VVGRGEIARSLLDLLRAPRARRLTAIREALASAGDVGAALTTSPPTTRGEGDVARGRRRGQAAGRESIAVDAEADAFAADEGAKRLAPAERRRGMTTLLEIWRDVARDLRLVQLRETASLRDPGLLDDLTAAAPDVASAEILAFLDRLTRAGELLVANVSPELIADALVLAWPQASLRAVAVGPGRSEPS
jgi:hypothetical protein